MMHLATIVLIVCTAVTAALPQDISVSINSNRERSRVNFCDCNGLKCGLTGRTNRVVGGRETSNTEMPWLGAMFYRGKLYCGASLLNSRYMITAAHCIKRVNKDRVEIVLGSHNISNVIESGREVRGVEEWWYHPAFDRQSFNNDIGVIKLKQAIDLNGDVRPICMPKIGAEYVGQKAVVAGWGRVSERGINSDVLRKVNVPIMSNEECKKKKYRPTEITKNMMCAGYDLGKIDACQGDSGGPMMIETRNSIGQVQFDIIGIVSWGQGCARAGFPGVYTKVDNYLNFIQEKTGGCLCPRE